MDAGAVGRKGYGSGETFPPSTSMSAAKGHPAAHPGRSEGRERPHGIPVEKLGWTKAQVEEARRRLASMLEDWDDPAMDVYDEEP